MSAGRGEKLARLALRLLENTREGKLGWTRVPRDDAFEAVFPRASVLVEEGGELAPGQTHYAIRVLGEGGAMVEQVSDTDLEAQLGEEAFLVLRDLFDEARRSALGVDDTIDHILSLLDEAR